MKSHALLPFLFALSTVAPTQLSAQSPLRPTRHAALPPIHQGAAVAVGDLDGDGDLDAVFANDSHPNQLLLNDGRARLVDSTAGRLTNVSPNASCSIDVADIDFDGDLDILIGNHNGLPNRVHRNDGGGHFTDVSSTALPPNAESTKNQVLADLDGDGDIDWFTVDSPNCHLYLNNGAGSFSDASNTHLVNLPQDLGDRLQVACCADIDGDGDIDLLIPNVGGMPTLIENQGSGILAVHPTQLPFVVGECLFNKFVDLDGDGDLDLLLDRTRILMLNQGDGTFVNVTASAFPSVHQQTMAILDVDGDGDIDLITENRVWRNDGTCHFVGTSIPHTTFPSLLAFYAADFDGDGDIDAPPNMNFTTQIDAPQPPMLGGNYSVDIFTRPGRPTIVIALGSFAGIQVPIEPFGTLLLEQSTMVTLAAQVVTFGQLHLSWPLPGNPALAGVELHYQALVEDSLRPLHFTNGIRDVTQ